MKIIAKFRSVTPYYWVIGACRLGTSLLALVTWPRGTERWGAEVIPITIPIIKPGHSAEQPLPGSHTTRPHCIGDPITLSCYSSASWCPYQCIFIYNYLPVGYFTIIGYSVMSLQSIVVLEQQSAMQCQHQQHQYQHLYLMANFR